MKEGKVENEVAVKLANGHEGSDDRSKVSEYSRIVAGINCTDERFDEVWKETEKEVWNRAAELVEKYAASIIDLSRALRSVISNE